MAGIQFHVRVSLTCLFVYRNSVGIDGAVNIKTDEDVLLSSVVDVYREGGCLSRRDGKLINQGISFPLWTDRVRKTKTLSQRERYDSTDIKFLRSGNG